MEIPTIEMIAEDTGITVDEINQEILARCNQYADAAMLRAKEYRTAFLDTGGTPEEWALHNIKITVRYEIKRQRASVSSPISNSISPDEPRAISYFSKTITALPLSLI